jgi:hypothetical protein
MAAEKGIEDVQDGTNEARNGWYFSERDIQ